MTTAMAPFLRRGELKSNARGATTTRFVEREGSARMINGVTVFGRSIPIPVDKRNCEGRVMVVSGKLRPFSRRSSTASARRFLNSASRWRCARAFA